MKRRFREDHPLCQLRRSPGGDASDAKFLGVIGRLGK